MRVVLAYDGSAGAQQALALAGAVAWPHGATIEIVSVIEPAAVLAGPPTAPGAVLPAAELDGEVTAVQQEQVDAAVRELVDAGRTGQGAVLRGRPATVIVDHATRLGADLVIVGSRGHGPIASLVLGSVSSEVVDNAPCPVLIARTPGITKVLFATDGSEPSGSAEELLAAWPIFENVPIHVVSIAHVTAPWHTGIAPTMHAEVTRAYAADVDVARAEHARIVEESAARLRAAGRSIETSVRAGDAAAQIIAAAEETAADLVVVGSRGRTGVSRMVLGSVARNVLHGSERSVLIVHGPHRQGPRDASD